MSPYALPDFVAKPKPRLDHRGFREQGGKVAEERIKKLRSRLSSLDASQEKLKTEQQRLYTSATRELDEAAGLQHSSDFNKDVDREDLRELIPKVVEQFKKTKSAFIKETTDIQHLGGEPSHLPQEISSLKETRQLSLIRKRTRMRMAISYKKDLDKDLRGLQSALESLKDKNDEFNPVDDERDKDVDQATDHQEDEANLVEEIKGKKIEIDSCKERINKLDQGIKKLSQQNKEDEKRVGDEEQDEDENVKLLTKKKEEKERKEMKDQKERVDNLLQLEKSILSMRTRSNNRYSFLSRLRFHRRRRYLEQMMERDWLDDSYYRSRFEPRSLLMMEQSDSSDESTDTETQNTVNGNCIRWLERQIGNAQTLEKCIETLQHYRQTMEGLESLKHVLRSELSLEQKWLNSLDNANSLELSGPTSSRPSHQNDHLSGGHLPDDEIYTPLGVDDFRVLILLPAPDSVFPLVCKLETWSMSAITGSVTKAPKKQYLALSYFWGPDVCNGRIYLLDEDDQDVPGLDDLSHWGTAAKRATRIRIRNNLFRALLRLRRHGTDAQAVAIWVDFLSIKQKDVEEKTAQLGKMVDIYSNASQVCIWLGESDSEGRSNKAMEFIPTIMDFAMLERYARDKSQAEKWYALGELMRDRWFSRRWVVQEMALAKDATVHCGEHAVRWSDFADAASLLVSNQEMIKSLFDFSDWREGQNTLGAVESFGAWILLESTSNLFRRKPNGEIKKPIKSIEYLVTSLKTFNASNTRDLIYSLVSIASDTSLRIWQHNSCNDGGENLGMDYNKSEVAVYQDFTEFCVRSSKSLDVICRPWAMPCEEKGTLPSWIPLLAKSEFGEPEQIYTGRKNGDNLVGPAESPTYEASGKSQCDAVFKTQVMDSKPLQAKVLAVKGFKLGQVHKLSPRNTGGVILRESLQMIGWEGFRQDSSSVPSQVWSTLVADRDLEGRVAPSWYQRACLRCLEVAHMFNNGDLNVGEILQGQSDMLLKYLKRVQNVTWNRRFFTAMEVETQGKETTEECQGEDKVGEVHEEGGVRSQEEKEDEPPLEETSDINGTSQGTEIVKTGEHGTNEEQTGETGDETGDNHTGGENEAVVTTIGEKREDEECGDGEKNNEDDDKEVSFPTVEENKAENKRAVDEKTNGQAGDEVAKYEKADDIDAGDEEKDDPTTGNNKVDDDSGSEEPSDEEPVKEESSELDVSEDGVTDKGTSEGEDSDAEDSDRESSVTSQDSTTFLGLCPPETEGGDFICILYGCSVPVILRETPDRTQMILIGEAYVHGKMDGEAMEDFPDRTVETFYIR